MLVEEEKYVHCPIQTFCTNRIRQYVISAYWNFCVSLSTVVKFPCLLAFLVIFDWMPNKPWPFCIFKSPELCSGMQLSHLGTEFFSRLAFMICYMSSEHSLGLIILHFLGL
jgi:hypothetical protein